VLISIAQISRPSTLRPIEKSRAMAGCVDAAATRARQRPAYVWYAVYPNGNRSVSRGHFGSVAGAGGAGPPLATGLTLGRGMEPEGEAAADPGTGPAEDEPVDRFVDGTLDRPPEAPSGPRLVDAGWLRSTDATDATAATTTTIAVVLARVRTRPRCASMTEAA
jgi:hypothetical protein